MIEENSLVAGEQINLFSIPDVLRKSNYLINTKYKMSATEHKIFNLSLAKVKYDEKENRPIAILSAKEVQGILNIKGNSVYSQMKTIANKLTGSKKILIEDKVNKKFSSMVLISVCTYVAGKGKMIVKFEPDTTDLVLNLKPSYTKLKLNVYKNLSNFHAMKLYEIFKSNMFKGDVLDITYGINDLKFATLMILTDEKIDDALVSGKMAIDEAIDEAAKIGGYNTYSSFKRAIDTAVKEINDYTDIHVDMEMIRTGIGGKVTKVRFIVKEKEENIISLDENTDIINAENKEIDEDKLDNLIDEVREIITEKLKIKDYKTLLEVAKYDTLLIKEKYEIMKMSNSEISNITGWLIKAIEENYQKPTPKEQTEKPKVKVKKNKFNDFEQRSYSDEQLLAIEKAKLGIK